MRGEMSERMNRALAGGLSLAMIGGGVASAQAPSQPDRPAARQGAPKGEQAKDAKQPANPAGEALPDLDDLLGIPKEARPDRRGVEVVGPLNPDEVDPDKAELARALSATEASEVFRQAIKQMADVADLLELGGDAGLRTQRIQAEIVKKLDVLIEQAEQQASQSSSSSSSEQQQQQQSQVPQQPQAAKPEQSPDQQQQDSREAGVPGARNVDRPLNELLDTTRAAWGGLPERVREAMSQGSNDRFSSIYKELTQEYYRRLAEENAPK